MTPQPVSQKTRRPFRIRIKTEHGLTFMARVKRWRVFTRGLFFRTDAPARRNFHILRTVTLPAVEGRGHDLPA